MFSMKVGWKAMRLRGSTIATIRMAMSASSGRTRRSSEPACCGRDGRMAVGGLIDHASPLGKLERELARTLRPRGRGGFS